MKCVDNSLEFGQITRESTQVCDTDLVALHSACDRKHKHTSTRHDTYLDLTIVALVAKQAGPQALVA